jgi:hypothetical protein
MPPRKDARNVRPSLSDDPKDKLAALGHARLRDSAEYRRAALYYDAVTEWYTVGCLPTIRKPATPSPML